MRTIYPATFACVMGNVCILAVLIPFAVAFRPDILLQISFWTFFAAIGAAVTMHLLRRHFAEPVRVFVALGCVVFLLSLVPIYLRTGILQEFPNFLLMTAVEALLAMHVVDSILIGASVIKDTSK